MKSVKTVCLKIWDEVQCHLAKYLAKYIAGFIIVIIGAFCAVFWKWLKAKHSFEIYNWMWVLILFIFLFLLSHFLRCMLRDRGHLKNPRDIINAIDNWFTSDINNRVPINKYRTYYFASVEKNLNLKRDSSKIYLPMVAFRHGYAFEMGGKTFKLSKLTHENDPTVVFEQYLDPLLHKLSTGEKEFILSCNDIDRRLVWPEGAAKCFLLFRPPRNEKVGIEIKDIGGDKILIILKE